MGGRVGYDLDTSIYCVKKNNLHREKRNSRENEDKLCLINEL